MEVWIDPVTKRIKALYDPGHYTGKVWADRGYERYDQIEEWMLPLESLAPKSPRPTEIVGENGKRYTIGADGKLKVKAQPTPI